MPSVGSLYATLSLDDQQYQDALKKAPGVASQTAAKINTAFARNPGIDNAAKGIAGLTSDLKIQAGALGLSAGAFNKLSAAGSALGVSQSQIIRTVAGLRGQLDNARAGVEPNVAAFRELGLNWRTLARARPDAAIAQVARATFLAGEGTKAYNTGLRILGADGLPKAQNFFRQIARGDLPAVTSAAGKTTESFTRGLAPALTSTFLRFAAPAVLLGTLKNLATSALTLGTNLTQQAAAIGLTTSRYQTLEFVARENNAAAQDLISAVSQLRISLRNAADGSESDRRKFEDLGLSWRDLISLAPDQALERVARATRSADTDTRIFGAGARLLGTDTFPKLRAALAAIATEGLPALDAALEKTGGKLSDDAVRRLDRAEKAIERFNRALVAVGGGAIADVLEIGDALAEITAADRALERLIDARLRLEKLGPTAPAIKVDPVILADMTPFKFTAADDLENAQRDFVRIVADASQKVAQVELVAATKALEDYAASRRERGKLTANATAEIAELEAALAKRTTQLAEETAAAQKKATEDRLKSERDAAEQRARIEKSTADRVASIIGEGEKKRTRATLDTAGKLKALDEDIAAARAVAKSTPDDRAAAATKLKALEEQIASLKAVPPAPEARVPGATELLNLERQIANARRASVTAIDEDARTAAAEALARLEAERTTLIAGQQRALDGVIARLKAQRDILAKTLEAAPVDERGPIARRLLEIEQQIASLRDQPPAVLTDPRLAAANQLLAKEQQIAAVRGEAPAPVAATVTAPAPITPTVKTPAPVKIDVTQPLPVTIKTITEPVKPVGPDPASVPSGSLATDPRLAAAQQILALEEQITKARAVVEASPTDRTAAAEKLNALEDERAALLAAQTAEAKRTRQELEGQAQAIIQTVDPLATYDRAVKQINKLHDAGLLTLKQWQKAIADARADLAKANVDTLVKQLKATAGQANEIAATIRGVGTAGLSDLREKAGIAGTAGSSKTERGINRALAKAEENAARGNFGAAEENLNRARELGKNVGGFTAADVLGAQLTNQPRRLDPSSNEGRAAAQAARLAEFTGRSTGGVSAATLLTTVPPPPAPGGSAAQAGQVAGQVPTSVPPAPGGERSGGADLVPKIDALVTAINGIAERLATK